MTKEEMWDRLNTYEFPCIRPETVWTWFSENPDNNSLAEVLAQVCNCVGKLRALSSESDDPWLEYFYQAWDELEDKLVSECIARLKERGQFPNVHGRHYQIRPFMEEHGYRDGHGWWIEDK